MNKEPKEEAIIGTHSKVIDLLKNEPKGKVLDAPSGEGALSINLKNMGFEVIALDIEKDKFIPKEEIKFICADLNKTLPFENESFNYIVCVEGIEHLENPFLLIREFSRVLKRNGKLIITTPNTLNIYNRIRYFIFGSRDVIQDIIDRRKELYEENISFLLHHPAPIDFPYLRNILNNNNFVIEKIECNRNIAKAKSQRKIIKHFFKLILLFSSIIIIIFNKILKPPKKSEGLLQYPLLWGEVLIIKCIKK